MLKKESIRCQGSRRQSGGSNPTTCPALVAGGLRSLSCLSTGRALFGRCSLDSAGRGRLLCGFGVRFDLTRLPFEELIRFTAESKEHHPGAASAKRGRLASPISVRSKFFRRGAAHRGDGTPHRRETWPTCKSPATRGGRVPALLLSGFWMACSFGKMACLAPFLRRHGPHSARAGAAFLRPLVRHASRTVRSVATRREVHRAAHAGDYVCAFARSES